MADILAVQNLYGTPDNVNTGATIYGDNTNRIRSSISMTDASNSETWASATETYDDAGNLIERVTTWDNGSQDVMTS